MVALSVTICDTPTRATAPAPIWEVRTLTEVYSFGTLVRRQRKALDLTQAALAQRVGCAESLIRKIEAEERRPSRQVAERLADALQIVPEERGLFVQVARGERSAAALRPNQPSVWQPDTYLPRS